MVMELLDGDSLHTRLNDYRIRGSQMPYGEMVRILLDVLAGLAYAHAEGMIHRDLKPANILLTKKGQAVLADFGSAQIIGSTQHTVSGALLGTLYYMAPEQGLQGICDARSDLYAMGIVFYEMLTQQPPYNADTPLAILMKHVNDPLPIPHQIDPNIPLALEKVVLKALAKDPNDRYQTAVEMADALRESVEAADIDVPPRVSLPLSFSTVRAPAESVAVVSGTARGQFIGAEFAAEETDASLGPKLEAELAALKEAEKQQMGQPVTGAGSDEMMPLPSRKLSFTGDVLTVVFILISTNLIMIMAMGLVNGRNVFEHFWPAELTLIAAGLFRFMKPTKNIWLAIPAGILLGFSLMFSLSHTFDAWDSWVYVWPLAVFLVMGVLWWTIKSAGDEQTAHEQASLVGYRFSRISYGLVVVIAIVSLFST
jgi:hypothetical protein